MSAAISISRTSTMSSNTGDSSGHSNRRPEEIRRCPGELIKLAFGFSGSDYVVLIDSVCDNGSRVLAQDRRVSKMLPEQLTLRIDMLPEKKCLKSVAVGPSGEWFLNYSNMDGTADQANWDVPNSLCANFLKARFQADEISDFLVAFGPNLAYIILDGDSGYLMSNNVPPELKQRIMAVLKKRGQVHAVAMFECGGYFISDSDGVDVVGAPPKLEEDIAKNGKKDVVNIYVAGDYSWVILRRNKFTVSGVDTNLTRKLQAHYEHQNLYHWARAEEIERYDQIMEKQNQKAVLKEITERRKLEKKKASQDEKHLAAMRKKKVVRRIKSATEKGLKPGMVVTVAGCSTQPGDCVIEGVTGDGILVVVNTQTMRSVNVEDVRRLCVHYSANQPASEVLKLVKATDKFEAAVVGLPTPSDSTDKEDMSCMFTASTESSSQSPFGAPPFNNSGNFSNSFSNSQMKQTIDWTMAGLSPAPRPIPNEVTDDPFESPGNGDPLSPLSTVQTLDKGTVMSLLQKAEPLRQNRVDFLPVFEDNGEKVPYDEYRCAEKIDVGRLRSLVKDLKKDKSARMSLMEAIMKRKAKNPERETKAQATFLRKLKICHELEQVAETLYKILKGYPSDSDNCVVHEVEYQHKDILNRGRLFAVGKQITADVGHYPRNTTLQAMPIDWLPTFCGSFGHFIEIRNSHATVLCSLAKHLDLLHMVPTLVELRENGKKWNQKFARRHDISEEAAEKWFNIIMMGGLTVYKSWLRSTKISEGEEVSLAHRLGVEVAVLADEVLMHQKFKWATVDRAHLISQKKSPAQIQTIMFMRVVQNSENEILSHMQRCFHNLGWIARSKAFDSLIVEPGADAMTIVKDCVEMCQTSCMMQGWDVKLKEKDIRGVDGKIKTVEDARLVLAQVKKTVEEHKKQLKG